MLIATKNVAFTWSSPVAGEPVSISDIGDVRALAECDDIGLIARDDHLLVRQANRYRGFDLDLDERITALLITDLMPLRALIGTEGAHLYEFDEDSGTARRVVPFDELTCRRDWHTPWGGPPAIRSLAASSDGRTVYADIHVGSIMRSEDAGRTWEPVNPSLHEDVHQVATCPAAPATVYANTANAVYVSEDRGRSWAHRANGLHARYGRAIAVHPNDPACLLASVSNGPRGGDGRLYRSDNSGRHWTHVVDGFPASCERNIDTSQISYDLQGRAWAAVDDMLIVSDDRAQNWTTAWTVHEPITLITCA
ncbi:MAG: hypothetical protein CMJ18_04470 [Phycisphaeraceae bacterium]|nr:hypothetical protein [Phycisphaeraceae bacterium]